MAGLQFRCTVQVNAGPKKVSCRAEARSSRSLNDIKCLHVRLKKSVLVGTFFMFFAMLPSCCGFVSLWLRRALSDHKIVNEQP